MIKARLSALCLLLLSIAVPSAMGSHLGPTVGCGTPGIYPSISAAVAALQPTARTTSHTITVSGACADNVIISDFFDLRIVGAPGTTITGLTASAIENPIIRADNSRLTLENLIITGDAVSFLPVRVGSGSDITIRGCTLQRGAFPGGLWLGPQTRATVSGTTIQDNVNAGIRVDANANLQIAPPAPGESPTVIQRNSFAGINAGDGASVGFRDGGNVIQNNGTGIASAGAHVFLCCSAGSTITNNRVGIRVNGGTLRINSPFLIEANSIAGVLVTGANANISGGAMFRNNGSAADALTGAVLADGSAHVDLFQSDVSGNAGSGLVVRDNSSARVFATSIIGNRGYGMRASALSTISLFSNPASTVSGNGNYDLFCSPNSFASGDDSRIGKMFCPGFDKSPEPNGKTPEP